MNWFKEEIKLAEREKVSHPENRPFLLLPEQSNGRAVILIHGFSSSPREMAPLGDKLVQTGFIVYGPRLPGHGTSPEDLAGRTAEDWLGVCERGYANLSGLGLTISAAGLSTGALLTLRLALEQPLDKLILLSPFLKLNHILAPYAGLLSYFIPNQQKNIPLEEQAFYYQQRPLKGIAQIIRLCRYLRRRLGQIKNPTLVLAATGDQTIAPGTAKDLFTCLGGKEKDFYCYGADVPHGLTTAGNPRQADVLQRCADFLE